MKLTGRDKMKATLSIMLFALVMLQCSTPQAYDKQDPVENYFRIRELQYLRNQDRRDRQRLELQERNTKSLERISNGARQRYRPIKRNNRVNMNQYVW